MRKEFAISKEEFEKLPGEIQEKCKSTLKAFDEVSVDFENGAYKVSTGSWIASSYAPDHKFIGVVYADDIFTEKERIINYVESFHSFPIEYKGKRDYQMLNEIGNDWSVKFKFEGEDIVRV